jgi:hypothetical protein
MSQLFPDVFADSPLIWLIVVGLAGVVVWQHLPDHALPAERERSAHTIQTAMRTIFRR